MLTRGLMLIRMLGAQIARSQSHTCVACRTHGVTSHVERHRSLGQCTISLASARRDQINRSLAPTHGTDPFAGSPSPMDFKHRPARAGTLCGPQLEPARCYMHCFIRLGCSICFYRGGKSDCLKADIPNSCLCM